MKHFAKSFQKLLLRTPSSSYASLFLVGASLGAVLLWQLWEFAPTVRFSLGYTIRGVLLGVLLSLFSVVPSLLLRLSPKQKREPTDLLFRKAPALFNPDLPIQRLQWRVARAVGEEVLLRGFILGWSLRYNTALAFLLNGVLSYVSGSVRAPRCRSEGERKRAFAHIRTLIVSERSRRGVVAGIEGLALAYFYWATRSLWGVVVARFVMESLRDELFTRAHALFGQGTLRTRLRRHATP